MGDADRTTVGEASNEAPRIRVRAGRGHAIDPHSVAERERRERFRRNLKALQDLVPNANANKSDQESMLDEIIEYINLLQMQIKVLSASKLGGVDSGGPLTANVAAEASAALFQPGGSLFKEGREFENNILKYMERDMNGAAEYLESKGLSLIPVAEAITIGLGSSRALDSIDKRNAGMGSGSDLASKEDNVIKRGNELVTTDKSNGTDSAIISCLCKIMEKE